MKCDIIFIDKKLNLYKKKMFWVLIKDLVIYKYNMKNKINVNIKIILRYIVDLIWREVEIISIIYLIFSSISGEFLVYFLLNDYKYYLYERRDSFIILGLK